MNTSLNRYVLFVLLLCAGFYGCEKPQQLTFAPKTIMDSLKHLSGEYECIGENYLHEFATIYTSDTTVFGRMLDTTISYRTLFTVEKVADTFTFKYEEHKRIHGTYSVELIKSTFKIADTSFYKIDTATATIILLDRSSSSKYQGLYSSVKYNYLSGQLTYDWSNNIYMGSYRRIKLSGRKQK